jgi:hypothetical protein
MSLETMTTILEWSLVILCIVVTAFPIWYGFFNRFWQTRAGLSIMLTSSAWALAWDLTAFFHWFATDLSLEWYFWIQEVVMVLSLVAGFFLLYALWYNRRHGTMVTVKSGKQMERRDV